MKTTLVINSFYITYIFLITTSVITFIEALRSPIPQVRHILNLETCISVIAGYFYGLFIAEINNKKAKNSTKENFATHDSIDEIPLEKINNMRYTDWIITTPFMLLALSMVLGYENKIAVRFKSFILVLISNLFMLGFGYA